MRVERIRKRHKFEWTINYIFGDLSFWYLERNHNQINKLEKILFLMQHVSLTAYGVPLLVYKTYIYDNGIYLRYLSDILRMQEPDAINDNLHIDEKVKQYQYEKMRKKYEKYTERELNDEIKRLIETNSLNKEYFIFEKYSHLKEAKRIRMLSHPFYYGIMGMFLMLAAGMGVLLIVDIFSFMGIGLKEYNLEETLQGIFFGTISLLIALPCRRQAIKKPTKYETKNNFPFTTFCNESEESDKGLRYDDQIIISTTITSIDKNHVETNLQLQNLEKRIFQDICEMMKECTKKYPDVHYAVTLERARELELENEKLIQNYSSRVYVYLTRNHIILERKEDEGEWPGSGSEILKVRRAKVTINNNYKEEIREGMEWASQVYLDDKESHYENQKESDQFVEQSSLIEWIDE